MMAYGLTIRQGVGIFGMFPFAGFCSRVIGGNENLIVTLAQSATTIDHRGLTTVQSVTFASSNEITIAFLLALALVRI